MAQVLLSRGGPGGGFGEASGDSPLCINGGCLAIDALGDGTDMVTFTPTRDYATVVLSSPDLEVGATYTVCTGGSSTGTATDGRYTGGAYTLGTEGGDVHPVRRPRQPRASSTRASSTRAIR